MQNQHLPPEETPQSAWNHSQADAQIHLAPSTAIGEEINSVTTVSAERRTYTEQGTVLPFEGMTGTEHETLLDKLIRKAHKQQRGRRISMGFYYTGVFSYLIYSVLSLIGQLPHLPPQLALGLVTFYGSALLVEVVARYRWSRSTATIAKIDDVRAVGTLAEAMDIPDKGILAQAEAALTRLLPRLRAEDTHLLTSAQRTSLYRRLKIENAAAKPDFLVALLEALEKVGDATALPAVQNLAGSTVTTANGTRVKAAANRCLPLLRLRIQSLETSGTLLRASSAEDTGSASLLRSAHGGNDITPEQLLRASNTDIEPQ